MASTTIERCSFDTIVINGIPYRDDLIIRPDGAILAPWDRKRDHQLFMDDLRALIDAAPEVIIMGTGMSGGVVPDPGLNDQLARLTIAFIAKPNETAIQIFNDLARVKRVGAGFHSTC